MKPWPNTAILVPPSGMGLMIPRTLNLANARFNPIGGITFGERRLLRVQRRRVVSADPLETAGFSPRTGRFSPGRVADSAGARPDPGQVGHTVKEDLPLPSDNVPAAGHSFPIRPWK
jgi:hypothetical protein